MSAELLNVRAAGALLGVSERTVWRLVKDQTLVALKVRGRTLLERAEVEAYVERQRSGQPRLHAVPSPSFTDRLRSQA